MASSRQKSRKLSVQTFKFFTLEEFELLAFDQFMLTHKSIVDALLKYVLNEKLFALELVQLYKVFVNQKSSHRHKEYTKHMFSFIIMSNKFRIFWNIMTNGDWVIMIEFLGTFYLLGKKIF